MNRRSFQLLAACCLAGTAFAAAAAAAADTFPSKPVRIIVPYATGGSIDALARALSVVLSEKWSKQVIVDNKPGGNEIVGATEVARSAADGYTLLMGTEATFSQNRYLFAKLPYDDDKAFSPVTRLVRVNMSLYVPVSFPADNVKEFVAYAKANPGLPYGSVGVGNVTHLAMVQLEKSADVKLTHVPYKGQGPVMSDMLAGQIPVAFGAVSVLEPFIKSGKLKAIAMAGTNRAKALPNVQTLAEGGFPDVNGSYHISLLAPHGTSSEVMTKIASDLSQVVNEPTFREKFIDPYAFDVVADTPEQFSKYVAADRERQQRRIKDANAKLD